MNPETLHHTMLTMLTLQANNLCLVVVLFFGMLLQFISYNSTCQTLSLNKNNESTGEEEGSNNHLMVMNQTNIDDVTTTTIKYHFQATVI
ncbi:MAG: hypothetical protein K0S67_406 [Nitrososphaeraceae archaeon]|jgi:hypothetical protein|nr:hypothetical protein [Nitrososphaeraceae archaeon]MCD6036522.1 hypothetical protein [Nitrososphaeraceae archaeon]MDF2768604.1 hypothetical protein [Nitrososphaeraceae archaeon]